MPLVQDQDVGGVSGVINSIYEMGLLDNLARQESVIHRLHPLVKLLTTLLFLIAVVSFGRYEISSLLPFAFYPVLVFALAELPVAPILKRVALVQFLLIGMGILNPVFDNYPVLLGGIAISRGWITFISLLLKGVLTVTASLLLIATTGIDKLAAALRLLRIPKIFVLQVLLTYRYISVLGGEVSRMMRAYSLRAPGQKGIQRSIWGPFAGQLLLRTFGRAQRVYQAMSLRGFTGEYHTGDTARARLQDFFYLAGWSLFFVTARIYNIPVLIGSWLTGVIK